MQHNINEIATIKVRDPDEEFDCYLVISAKEGKIGIKLKLVEGDKSVCENIDMWLPIEVARIIIENLERALSLLR